MARGWESKSAEEQLEQVQEQRAEAAKAASQKEAIIAGAVHLRARRLLELKRERILLERTNHPARRAALLAALKDIESELVQLG